MLYFSDQIEVTDELDTLQCHHYKECNADSPSELKAMRGVIADGTQVLCKSFGFTPELTTTQVLENSASLSELLTHNFKVFDSYEGTLLRLWWDSKNELWRLSTHRKIDAFFSRWGSDKSYGELFVKCLSLAFNNTKDWADTQDTTDNPFDDFTSKLHKHKVYVLLLRSGKENRVVCNAYDDIELFIIGTFDKSKDWKWGFGAKETSLCCPNLAPKCSSVSEITDYVNAVDPYKIQGVVVITENGEAYKILNNEYFKLNNLRGNNPNLIKRYVELRNTQDLEGFLNLYPEHVKLFESFDKVFADVCNNVFKKYMNRYVRKRVTIAPPEQFYIMKLVHEQYIRDKINVSIQLVERVMNSQTAKQLYYIYQQYIQREEQLGNGNFIPKEDADKLFEKIKRN
jgi:hypothetical protein